MVTIQVKQLWRSIQDFITQNDHQVIMELGGTDIQWLFSQKQVIDVILSGKVNQHAIKANDLSFKVCAYVWFVV